LANVLRRLDSRDWELRIVDNWPQRAERTLGWVAVNTLHDAPSPAGHRAPARLSY